MAKRVKLKVVLEVEYDADPKYYDTAVPDAMAAIDQSNWRRDPLTLFSAFEDEQFVINVSPMVVGSRA